MWLANDPMRDPFNLCWQLMNHVKKSLYNSQKCPIKLIHTGFAAYVGLAHVYVIFFSKFNNEYTSKWPLLPNGEVTKPTTLRAWMSLPKRWEMALTTIPYKTKQLTFKMEAVNAAPFPNAISL